MPYTEVTTYKIRIKTMDITIIKDNYNNEKRNWLLTSYNDTAKQIPNNTSRTPDIARDYVGMTPPTHSGSYDKNSRALSRIEALKSGLVLG